MPAGRVVVTGGAGFIGHHLVHALQDQGTDVVVIDDLSNAVPEGLSARTRLEQLDISRDDLASSIAAWRPSIVYHLAAQVSVPRSMEDPARDLEVNAIGTLRLIDAARSAGVPRVVFVSSGGAVYGETASPATESTPPAPASYYGAHKLLAEHYVRWSGLAHVIARPSNVYGPDQPASGEGAVIAAFVAAARNSSPLVIHGDGTQRRDFIHVADVVTALVLLGGRHESGTWNVSSGVNMSVVGLVDLLAELTGRPLKVTNGDRRPGDVSESSLSSERLRQLGWLPRMPLAVGLRQLLEVDDFNAEESTGRDGSRTDGLGPADPPRSDLAHDEHGAVAADEGHSSFRSAS